MARKKNRPYYNVYFPLTAPTVGKRFFFFDTLTWTKNNDQANQLSGDAENLILGGIKNIYKQDKKGQLKGTAIINNAMTFLKQTIEYEKKQEYEYFKQHIEEDTALKKIFSQCFTISNNSIISVNYLQFINVINEFYKGAEEYKYNLKYETERLRELQKIFDEFYNLTTKERERLRKQAKKNNKDNDHNDNENQMYYDEHYLKDAFELWLKQRSKNEKKLFSTTETLDNRIQRQLQKVFKEIWENKKFRTAIQEKLNETGNTDEIKQEAIAYLVTEFSGRSTSTINEILEKNLTEAGNISHSKTTANKIAKEFFNFIGFDEKNATIDLDILEESQRQEIIDLINKMNLIMKDVNNQGRKIRKSLFQQTVDESTIKGTMKTSESGGRSTLQGLTQDAQIALQEILQELLGDDYQHIVGLTETEHGKNQTYITKSGKKKTRKRIVTLRKEVITNIKLYLQKLDENAPVKIFGKGRSRKDNYELISETVKILLQGKTVFGIKGQSRILSEMSGAGAIAQRAANSKSFATTITANIQKSDATFIEIGSYMLEIENPNEIWETISKKILEQYEESNNPYSQTDKEIKDTINQTWESKYGESAGFTDGSFSIEAETKRKENALRARFNEVEKTLKENGATEEEIEKSLQNLKNSFQISTTVKSYDTYDNKLGFSGGSLGGNVEQQVENICKMMEYGGITPPDRDWLTFAVYNTGENLVGSTWKNRVEILLSTVAVMLLFDDAGQQAQYITQQSSEMYKNQASTKFLHLYYLNGVYYPSSFILQLTYDGLKQSLKVLDKYGAEVTNHGGKVTIENTIGIQNQSGGQRDEKSGRIYTTSQTDWYDTFSDNREKVKIHLTFLAGMLDILEQLNNMMQPVNNT